MEEKKKQTEPEACKVAKKCGGCQYQGVPYKEQLKKKQKMVNALLSKYGKVEPIIGMENCFHILIHNNIIIFNSSAYFSCYICT